MSTSANLPDLDDDPQLACVALLQSALPITRAALEAHHGDWGSTGVPEAESQSVALVLLLARIIDAHCCTLADLLDAYRSAIENAANADDDKPF
jgi:hypothetical protein